MTRNIVKDTSVLMAASATWYGVQVRIGSSSSSSSKPQ
jgi:hypothetical protein